MEVCAEVLGELDQGWDCEVWEDVRRVREEGPDYLVEGAEVGVGVLGHFAGDLYVQVVNINII